MHLQRSADRTDSTSGPGQALTVDCTTVCGDYQPDMIVSHQQTLM